MLGDRGGWGTLVGSHGLLNPVQKLAHVGVDSGPVLLGTAFSPRDNSLQLSIAHHRATRVILEGQRRNLMGRGRERERTRSPPSRELLELDLSGSILHSSALLLPLVTLLELHGDTIHAKLI